MTDVVFEFDGTLDKFIGDCVMALFGVPASTGSSNSDAINAVTAAAKMFDQLEKLMADKPENERFTIRVGSRFILCDIAHVENRLCG